MAEKTNGNAADRKRERQEMKMDTLAGDVRDQILRIVRTMPDVWQKLTQDQQQDVIDRIERTADNLVDEAVDLVASRGSDFMTVTIGDVAYKPGTGIVSKITTPFSQEAIAALCSRVGNVVVLVARDADAFKGERAPAEPDNIGDLKIPREQLQPPEQHAH